MSGPSTFAARLLADLPQLFDELDKVPELVAADLVGDNAQNWLRGLTGDRDVARQLIADAVRSRLLGSWRGWKTPPAPGVLAEPADMSRKMPFHARRFKCDGCTSTTTGMTGVLPEGWKSLQGVHDSGKPMYAVDVVACPRCDAMKIADEKIAVLRRNVIEVEPKRGGARSTPQRPRFPHLPPIVLDLGPGADDGFSATVTSIEINGEEQLSGGGVPASVFDPDSALFGGGDDDDEDDGA